MMRCLLFAITCMIASASAGSVVNDNALLDSLEAVLTRRPAIQKAKEERIRRAHIAADAEPDARKRFEALDRLFNEYNSFNIDSAYSVAVQRETLARRLGDSNLLYAARMNRADALCKAGMYKDAADIMDSITRPMLPDYLVPYYYYIKRTSYGLMADYSAFAPQRERYHTLTNTYRDSILQVTQPGTVEWCVNKADRLNAAGDYAAARDIITRLFATGSLSAHEEAFCALTLSESYKGLGDNLNRKRQLLISSIADQKGGIREYVSLRELAMILFKEGDTERAYRYLAIAVEDAEAANARQRLAELSNVVPTVNGIYFENLSRQKRIRSWLLAAVSVLSVLTLLALFVLLRQKKRIQTAKDELEDANRRLTDFNRKLREANATIADNSRLKEEYIGKYMNQCSLYIDKLDNYRRRLGRAFQSGKTSELQKELKADSSSQDLKEFFAEFDATFLQLFPTFVDDFNALLQPEEAIVTKQPGRLTPELRIFALIRLGITDSQRIAGFLRYSLTTIYNYRTKVRNKAAGQRDKLEEEVMKIGRGG